MSILFIKVIGTDSISGMESILATIESDHYTPEHLDSLVKTCLKKSLETINASDLGSLRSWSPEISVSLSADEDESVRPSLHLNQDTLQRVAEAGATFDFDPYV